MQETLLKFGYFERGLLKSLKKVNLIFSFELNSFKWSGLRKQKGPETIDQSLM